MPTLSQLEYIAALHRTGHFGRAAAECHISQPTLSTLIAKAEEELGVTLFDRRTKPVVATEQGRLLIAKAEEVLAANARFLSAAHDLNELSGPFTLGVIPTLAPYVLPWFLGPFAKRFPRVELTVQERTTEGILEAIRTLRMDAGLLATPLGEPSLETRVLFYDPFYVYADTNSPLLQADELSLTDIEREDLWLLEDGHCFRNQVIHLCGSHTRQVLGNVRFEAGSFETLRLLIDQVGGFTLLPESFARLLPAEVRVKHVRPFADPQPLREVSLVSHRQHWKAAILDAIGDTLRTHAPRSLPRERGVHEVLPIAT